MVSIVIPCFKEYWRFLPECLNSIKEQSDSRFEVIIDGSTSVSEARNNGVARAKGEYIILLDADDKIAPSYVKTVLERKADILMVGYKEFGESEAIGKLSTEYIPEIAEKEDLFIIGAAFRKDLFVGFREMEREDRDFWHRMLLNGAKVDKIDEILYFYGKHGESRSSNLCA